MDQRRIHEITDRFELSMLDLMLKYENKEEQLLRSLEYVYGDHMDKDPQEWDWLYRFHSRLQAEIRDKKSNKKMQPAQ
ncbi:MAG: hypothetical protein OIF51_07330 [Cellvibrionaceae bacterium]|nr:hypothetical protein [Cellvibrionaceae bacterium]